MTLTASTVPPSLVFLTTHSSAGGAQEIWMNLAESYIKRGFRAKLCALYPGREEVRETASGLEWHYLAPRRPSSPMEALRLLASMVRFLRTERPDYVLSAMPAANIISPLAGRLAGGKTGFAISHHTPVQTYSPVLNAVDGITGQLRNVRAIVSVSEAVSRSLDGKSRGYKAKRQTIYNALPQRIEEHLAGLASQRLDERPVRRRLVATGRLAEQKNYPVLLRAAALLPDVEIRIVGSGPDEAELKALAARLGVADRVEFLGQRSREEALAILASGDVFVQPSLFEGHSLGLIEAAKLGLPLLVSNVPVQLEGITGPDGALCGLAVDPQNEVALAEAARTLLEDDAQYEHWTGRARALAASATFENMLAAYDTVILPQR